MERKNKYTSVSDMHIQTLTQESDIMDRLPSTHRLDTLVLARLCVCMKVVKHDNLLFHPLIQIK